MKQAGQPKALSSRAKLLVAPWLATLAPVNPCVRGDGMSHYLCLHALLTRANPSIRDERLRHNPRSRLRGIEAQAGRVHRQPLPCEALRRGGSRCISKEPQAGDADEIGG